jgi:hypothetical protein
LLRTSAERSASTTRGGGKLPATERRVPGATTAVVAACFRFSLSVTARTVVPTRLRTSAAALSTIFSAKQQQLPAAGCFYYSIPAATRVIGGLSGRVHQVLAAADGGCCGVPTTNACVVVCSLPGASGGTVQQLPAATVDQLPTGAADRVPTTTGIQFGPSDRHVPATAAGVRLSLPSLSKIGAFAAARHSGPCTTVLPGASRRVVLPSAGDTAP